MKLTIVLPALNEEESIGDAASRCLEAREKILSEGLFSEVDIVVVSDGSTDRTAEIARSIPGVQTIVFERNRGYGAAIKAGWERSRGDFVAFLDADGTCDPSFFIPMCRKMMQEGLDVVIGSRMGSRSRMPLTRRVGNALFAFLLGTLSRKDLTDSASGMRVVRRSSLARILPLPNGLNFTPAMSARVLMDDELKIGELPVDYRERSGRSKLRVVRDGFRFLGSILSTAAHLKPSRISIPAIAMLLALSIGFGVFPTLYYLQHGEVLEWMIYRFILVSTLLTMATALFCATIVAEHTVALSLFRYERYLRSYRAWWGAGGIRLYLGLGFAAFVVSVGLLWPGVREWLATGEIRPDILHWSRMMVAAFCILNFVLFVVAAFLLRVISFLNVRQPYLLEGLPVDLDHAPEAQLGDRGPDAGRPSRVTS